MTVAGGNVGGKIRPEELPLNAAKVDVPAHRARE